MSELVRVGNVEIIGLFDLPESLRDVSAMFPDVPALAWAPYRSQLEGDGTQIRAQMGFFALRAPGGTVVVDTGLGPGPFEQMGGARGQLMANLNAAGIRAEDVDAVFITHLHGDHVGWNVTWETAEKPAATFPRARYYVSQADWDYFTSPEVLPESPHVPANVAPLRELGALELVDDGQAVTPEVTTLATPGHTPGHMSALVSSGGERALIAGDLFHTGVQTQETGWNVGFDVDKPAAARTRESVMARIEAEGFTVAAGHMPHGSNIGRVVRLEGRRAWQVL